MIISMVGSELETGIKPEKLEGADEKTCQTIKDIKRLILS